MKYQDKYDIEGVNNTYTLCSMADLCSEAEVGMSFMMTSCLVKKINANVGGSRMKPTGYVQWQDHAQRQKYAQWQ